MNAKCLMYDDIGECDICDGRNKIMAHIQGIDGNVHVFCIECLDSIVQDSANLFEDDE